ncbi:restriction endonuclease [Streptomyces flavofungini]|uniref:restriction endonuclease n=1 Tax=Streptomyces flavofungini TaxID=68200 RepID=UPI0034DFF72A
MTTPSATPVRDACNEASLLGREPYLALVRDVLSWTAPPPTLEPRDYEQIAVRLVDQARALSESLRRHCAQLPRASGTQALTEIVLKEAERRLSAPPRATMARVQNLARLVRALYERLDRLHSTAEPSPAALSS